MKIEQRNAQHKSPKYMILLDMDDGGTVIVCATKTEAKKPKAMIDAAKRTRRSWT